MNTIERLCRAAAVGGGNDPDLYYPYDEAFGWELYRPSVLAILSELQEAGFDVVKRPDDADLDRIAKLITKTRAPGLGKLQWSRRAAAIAIEEATSTIQAIKDEQ